MKKYLIYCIFTMAVLGCSSEKKSHSENSDETSANLESSDTTMVEKIIKTADMRFRVKDVQDTKEKLSAAIKAEGGTLTEFSIESNIEKFEKVAYSTDSLLELTAYRKVGTMVAKVPSDKLDEFTNKVTRMAIFVDNQSLKMDDQSTAYLANVLKNKNRVEAVAQLNKHANKKSNNVETALDLKDDFVDRKIANLDLDKRVRYSDITLNFYQDNTVSKLVVGNDNLYSQQPPFFHRFWLNIQNGWMIFKEFLLIMTNLWVAILLVGGGIMGYKYYRKNRKPAASV